MRAPQTSVSTAGLQLPSQHCKWKSSEEKEGGRGEKLPSCPRRGKGKGGKEKVRSKHVRGAVSNKGKMRERRKDEGRRVKIEKTGVGKERAE